MSAVLWVLPCSCESTHLTLRAARCHSARSFITVVTWPEPGSCSLPVTDTSPDLQPVPALSYSITQRHTRTHTHQWFSWWCFSFEIWVRNKQTLHMQNKSRYFWNGFKSREKETEPKTREQTPTSIIFNGNICLHINCRDASNEVKVKWGLQLV